jgi:3-hydroxyisobutyrate dehydrogenase-like beta-hydroxyacid dehydrogenase
MDVGIVGTGKMGTAIACNLLDRGYRVSVWNVDRSMMDEVIAAGATPFEDIASMVGSVGATVVMLWDDDVAREISLGRVIPAAREGQIVIESSTLSPQMYQALADAAVQRSVDFLASPVLGSVDGARTGSLTLLAGGTRAAFERARELLNAMGATVTFTGSAAASGHLKLAGNCVLGVAAGTIGELLEIASRAGVDRAQAIETIAFMLERVATKRQQLLDRDTAPRFSANALLKDLRLAQKCREAMGVNAPLLDSALSEYERAVATGLGARDYIAAGLVREVTEMSE